MLALSYAVKIGVGLVVLGALFWAINRAYRQGPPPEHPGGGEAERLVRVRKEEEQARQRHEQERQAQLARSAWNQLAAEIVRLRPLAIGVLHQDDWKHAELLQIRTPQGEIERAGFMITDYTVRGADSYDDHQVQDWLLSDGRFARLGRINEEYGTPEILDGLRRLVELGPDAGPLKHRPTE